MAKSLRKQLTDAADLVAILGLTQQQAFSVRFICGDCEIQMKPLDLAHVSRQLDVPRKKITFSEHEYEGETSIHIGFVARGAKWCAVLPKKDMPEFYAAMGVQQVKAIEAKPRGLPSPRKRLQLF